jgi:hypothetical protein
VDQSSNRFLLFRSERASGTIFTFRQPIKIEKFHSCTFVSLFDGIRDFLEPQRNGSSSKRHCISNETKARKRFIILLPCFCYYCLGGSFLTSDDYTNIKLRYSSAIASYASLYPLHTVHDITLFGTY